MIYRARMDVPSEWQADLETVGGKKADGSTWLQLVWLPGTPEEPIQRFSIYELQPDLSTCESHPKFAALNGPNPSEDENSFGCSHGEWVLYRDHKAVPFLFWILQGDRGGHRWKLGAKERGFLKALGRPSDVPVPGSQAYAPWDNRVKAKILEYDRLASWRKQIDGRVAMRSKVMAKDMVMRMEAAQERLWAEATMKHLEEQVEGIVHDAPRTRLQEVKTALLEDHKFVGQGDVDELRERVTQTLT